MITSFIAFLVVLSLLVFVHEAGHFLMAKKVGIKVEEFGFGYPPKIKGIKIGETEYSLNWLPFGGFVRIYGENEIVEKEKKKSFLGQPKRKRFLILISGVVMNFLLGITAFSLVYFKTGIPTKTTNVNVIAVSKDSPAQKAGVEVGDRIVAVVAHKTTAVKDINEFIKAVDENLGKEVILRIERQKEIKDLKVIPRKSDDTPENEGHLGVGISSIEYKYFPWWQMPFLAGWTGLKEALAWGKIVTDSLVVVLKQIVSGQVPSIAGPVGVYQLTSLAVKEGWLTVVQFTGVLSVNLAILNILPIPALDGGRLVFLGAEVLVGRKKVEKLERKTTIIGMALLITLMILVSIADLLRIF